MTIPRPAALERREQLELLAVDGLASDAERAELGALGLSVEAGLEVRRLMAQVLRPAAIPDLADAVMTGLHADEARDHQALCDALRQALDAGPAPELADDLLLLLDLEEGPAPAALRELLDGGDAPDLHAAVAAELGLSGGAGLDLLRDALKPGSPPDLTDDVMAALGLSDDGELRQALRGAPAPVDLADDVMAALGLSEQDEDDEAPLAEVIPLRPATAARELAPPAPSRVGETTWRFPAIAMAAAAALLLFFTGSPARTSPDQLAFELAPINHVDIEELSTGDAVMVQVLQMDENAPTIIFIDEMSEDDGGMPL